MEITFHMFAGDHGVATRNACAAEHDDVDATA